MSKLYASLNLSPENFLHLQAAAKQYMLDPAHPERQNCVGNRGKGDTDMVKLRLFNCVRDFLAEGEGLRFFGEEAERGDGEGDGGERFGAGEGKRWVWPRDGNKIVSLVTPLLRRMVTNERQRQYAVETRRGGAGKKNKGGDGDGGGDTSMLDQPETQQEGSWSAEGQPTLDPELGQAAAAFSQHHHHPEHAGIQQPGVPEHAVQIYVLRGKNKLLPRLDIMAPPDAPSLHPLSWAELQQVVEQQLHNVPRLLLDLHDEDARVAAAASGAAAPPLDQGPGREEGQWQAVLDAQRLRQATTTAARALAAANAGAADEHDANGGDGLNGIDGEADRADEGEGHGMLFDAAATATEDHRHLGVTLRAVGPHGLVAVQSEEEWERVKGEVAAAVWLEGCLKVLIEV